MISAAVRSSIFVWRIRPAGFSSVSEGSPFTSGMTATPVSNPDNPRASFGNRIAAIANIITGLPCCATSAIFQLAKSSGCSQISRRPTMMTMTLSVKYAATSTTAIVIASRNPLKKSAPSATRSARVKGSG